MPEITSQPKLNKKRLITQGEPIEKLAVNAVNVRFLNAVNSGHNVLLRTPTGSGKTSIINALIANGTLHPDHKVAIIQPTTDLTLNYASTHAALSPLTKVQNWSENGEGYLPEEIETDECEGEQIASIKYLS